MLRRTFIPLLVFLLGIALGFCLRSARQAPAEKATYLRHSLATNGELTCPLLEIESPSGGDLALEAVRDEVQSYIKRRLAANDAAEIAFYLMDLNQGRWVGINEGKNFAASLLKIPLLIAILNKAQVFPEKLTKKIKYETQAETTPQNITPSKTLQLGESYTIEELLRFMIIYSDNTAKSLILENVDQGYLARVYSDLGLSVPDFKNPDYLISLKDFVTYFRVLYSVTYLNKTMSEKALRLLTETEFKDGIAAGLPPEITVAHKFGERGYPNGTKELHDCGIVYLSKSPYLLGVMTKGRDFDILKDIVKDIYRIVYRYRSEKGLRMY